MDPSRLVLRASFHRSCLLSPLLIQRFLAFGGTERSMSSNPRRVPRTRTKSVLEQYCSPGCTPDRPSLAKTSARRTPTLAPAFPRPKGIRSENHTSIDRGDCFRILPHPIQPDPIRWKAETTFYGFPPIYRRWFQNTTPGSSCTNHLSRKKHRLDPRDQNYFSSNVAPVNVCFTPAGRSRACVNCQRLTFRCR
jgi:hypothetical protein